MSAATTGLVPGSVHKALALVEEVAIAGAPQRLGELAQRTGMTKPTAHRLLRGLVEIGYVRPAGSGRYGPGPALVGVAAATLGGIRERPLIRRVLTDVHTHTGLTASYAIRWDDSVVVLDNVEPDQAYRITPQLGVRTPLASSAAGAALVAAEPDGTEKDHGVPAGILDHARRHGYAVDDTQPGVCAIAAAVETSGPFAGALMVTGVSFILNDEAVETFGPMLAERAGALAASIRSAFPAAGQSTA